MGRASATAPTVIFMHLGKTGGATLRRIVRRNFPKSKVLALRNPASAPHGFLSTLPIEHFAEFSEEERERFRFIVSHMMFGLHEFVPRASTYITLLRNPVSRAISGYKNALDSPGHRFHEVVVSRRMDLEDYLKSDLALEMDNSQMRAIVGDVVTPYGGCTTDMLERAKRSIDEHFTVVGISERFDETLVALRHVFGWSKLYYVQANVSPHKIPRSSIPPRTIALIEEQNRFDIELYGYATQKFDRQIGEVPTFDRDLAHFRRGNSLYRPWGTLSYTIPVRVRSRITRSTA
jgi:hypothetical protein